MLVLSRKAQEKIKIGDDITITILKLKGKTVRVGIEAPNCTQVLRGELSFDQDKAESPRSKPANKRPVPKAVEEPRQEDWPRDPNASVSHARVPKSRVATVLPAMLGDSGPLRAMLDRRGASQEF